MLERINDFTLDSYSALLKYFQRSHTYTTFSQYDDIDAQRTILLRHDIDFSLDHALELAQIEAELGISATYFLLFSAPYYNLLGAGSSSVPRRLRELGHEVGLHYDVAVIEAGGSAEPLEVLLAQARLLGELSGTPVATIAQHNPSLNGRDPFAAAAPFINAYDERFVQQMGYYSDSCMAWRDSFIEAAEQDSFPDRVHLLIHPIIWTEQLLSREQKLERMYNAAANAVRDSLGLTQEIWRNHSGVLQHDARCAEAASAEAAPLVLQQGG